MFDVGSIIKGAGDIIGKFKLDPSEKLEAQQALNELQVRANETALEYEASVLKERSAIIQAEAKGSWMAANWRPITMLAMLALLFLEAFGVTKAEFGGVNDVEIFDLLQLGMGGYIVGRSAEKITQSVMPVVREWKGKGKG